MKPVYRTGRQLGKGTGGTYNFYLLALLPFALVAWCGGWPWWFFGFLVASLVAALLLDTTAWRTKLAPASLPAQLWAYGNMMLDVAIELAPSYAAAALLYMVFQPSWLALVDGLLPAGLNSFWLLYGIYFVGRAFYTGKYVKAITTGWDTLTTAPFQVKRQNLATQRSATLHVLWSFFIGNVGLVARCGSQLLILTAFGALQRALGLDAIAADLRAASPVLFWALAVGCLAPWVVLCKRDVAVVMQTFYASHRTLHETRCLFDGIHRIHHKAVYPTLLDSGSISPAEFLITEYSAPNLKLLPQPLWVLLEAFIAFTGHFPAHHGRIATDAEAPAADPAAPQPKGAYITHHHQHHRLFTKNYGFDPSLDKRFETEYVG